jgi:hypothetical protein
MSQPKIELKNIHILRDYDGKVTGSATFGTQRSNYSNSETTLNLVLSVAQVNTIIMACGDSIKEQAQKQAQGFYESAAEVSALLLEAPKEETTTEASND